MPYDEELAARIRRVLRGRGGVTERKMFGGLAFLRDGKMCCGVIGQNLVTRVREEDMTAALRRAHVRPMDFTGRPLREFVSVAPPGVATERSLREWVTKGIAFVEQRVQAEGPARRG